MKKNYQTPDVEMVLFKPDQNLAADWIDLNNGTVGNQPQDGAVTSENDIIIKL